MLEQGLFTKHIFPETDICMHEGKRERPKECLNNPMTHKNNHRPRVCEKCPGDPEIYQIAEIGLPSIYIRAKQEIFAEGQKNKAS
jgi:hypothetical protein